MKKLALIATFLGLAITAHANELVTFTASCKTPEENTDFLKNYSEQPFAGGPSVVRQPNGELASGTGIIYVDPVEKGFTVLIEFPEVNKSCVLLMGDDFAPIVGGNPT